MPASIVPLTGIAVIVRVWSVPTAFVAGDGVIVTPPSTQFLVALPVFGTPLFVSAVVLVVRVIVWPLTLAVTEPETTVTPAFVALRSTVQLEAVGTVKVRRARRVYQLTDPGKARFAELVADTGPQNYTDDGFGVHLAFFNRTPAEARMRILEGRRRQVEERREGLREAIARASNSLDRYTKQLHQLGLESSEREVKWLNDLIAAERVAQGRPENQP